MPKDEMGGGKFPAGTSKSTYDTTPGAWQVRNSAQLWKQPLIIMYVQLLSNLLLPISQLLYL